MARASIRSTAVSYTHLDVYKRQGSRHARLIEAHPEIVGNLLFVRFAYKTGDASGHNMVTNASDALMQLSLIHI